MRNNYPNKRCTLPNQTGDKLKIIRGIIVNVPSMKKKRNDSMSYGMVRCKESAGYIAL